MTKRMRAKKQAKLIALIKDPLDIW